MNQHDRAGRRHASPVVRNPILALPGTARLLQLDPHTRAEESWRRHKAPMAAHWKAVSVYAGHLARLLR